MAKCSYQQKVAEFAKIFKCYQSDKITLPVQEIRDIRKKLLKEEYEEYVVGEEENDIVQIADALTDMLYIIFGTAEAYGIVLEETFDEVHKSNLTKLDENGNPIFREDGKVLKGVNYQPPNIKKVLKLE